MRVRGNFDTLIGAVFFVAILAVLGVAALHRTPVDDAPPFRLALI